MGPRWRCGSEPARVVRSVVRTADRIAPVPIGVLPMLKVESNLRPCVAALTSRPMLCAKCGKDVPAVPVADDPHAVQCLHCGTLAVIDVDEMSTTARTRSRIARRPRSFSALSKRIRSSRRRGSWMTVTWMDKRRSRIRVARAVPSTQCRRSRPTARARDDVAFQFRSFLLVAVELGRGPVYLRCLPDRLLTAG